MLTRDPPRGKDISYSPCVTQAEKELRAHYPCSSPEQTNSRGPTTVWKYILPGALCLGACTSPTATKSVATAKQIHPISIMTAQGRASYYGGRHNGRTTSSGAVFNASRMTAAHRTLPFGTKVIVTNLENSVSCNVEITDRGPALWTGRVIDVSEAAARCLDMFRAGVIPVKLDILG
jgi:rare lipoprotein A